MKARLIAAVLAASPAAALAQAPGDATAASGTYGDNLAALSQVLGQAHYIRRLCYGRGDQRWRNQMMRFMDLEGPPGTPQRKAMSDGFNDGYREQEERFPACTPEAQSYEQSLNAKGARLANALAASHRD
jgi:uncharacterized protein (TIGR02301 family)